LDWVESSHKHFELGIIMSARINQVGAAKRTLQRCGVASRGSVDSKRFEANLVCEFQCVVGKPFPGAALAARKQDQKNEVSLLLSHELISVLAAGLSAEHTHRRLRCAASVAWRRAAFS
jgi:hypothetical protein